MVQEAEQESATATKRSSRVHRRLIVVAVLLAVVAGVGYAISRAPAYLARYLVRNYFQSLHIDTSGVDTIDIHPLRGEITFGPVTFKGAEGEAGQMGRIGVKIDMTRLLRRQALLHSAVIEGIRIDIRQAAHGEFSVNGIPLTRILAERATIHPRQPAPSPAPSGAPPEADERKQWGAGLDRLELRDSRIVFTDPRGGKATLEVNELDLEGFATWAPDDPGRIRLDGELNRIHIAISGTATPFADNIGVDATLAVTDTELGKIETYTGALGFSTGMGRMDLVVETKGSKILSDGRVDARLAGKANLTAFDLAHPKFGSLQLNAGALNLDDIRLLYDATGTIDVAGAVSLDLDTMALRLEDGTKVGLAGATVGLPDVHARLPGSGLPSVMIAPQLDVHSLRLNGRYVEGTVDRIAIRLSDLGIAIGEPGPPLTATGSVEVDNVALVLPLKKPIKIGAETLALDLAAMRFAFQPDRTVIDGAAGLDATALSVAVTKHGTTAGALLSLVDIAAGRLTGRLSTLALDDAAPTTKVKVASPSLVIDRFRLGAPVAPGTDLQVAASPLDLKSIDIDVADGATLDVSGRSVVSSPKLSVSAGGRGGAGAAIELAEFSFDPRRFAYRENGPNSDLAFQGRIDANRVGARLPSGVEGMMAVVDLGRLRTAVEDLAMDIDNPAPQWHARHVDLALASLYAAFPGALSAVLNVKDVTLADGTAASRGEYGFDKLAIGRVDASLTHKPSSPGIAAASASGATAKPEKTSVRTWPPKDLPLVRIGRFGLLDGARIVLIDQTLSPLATSTADIETLAVENIDTTHRAARSNLRLKARLDQAEMTADGWALPFQSKPEFELRAKVNELLLPNVSPYVGPEIGLDVVQGKLTATADAQADAGRLVGEVRAKVFDLGFADRPEAGSDRISRSIGVPLSTIISLLEDADGSIVVNLPFEGDLLSPEFDYSDMMWSGIFRVLRALIRAPFKLITASISLLSATEGGGGGTATTATTAPALAPLTFPPGEAALVGGTRDAAGGLRQVLQDRPKMQLSLCGVATANDLDLMIASVPEAGRAAAAEQAMTKLQELALLRTKQVQDALTEGGEVEQARLRVCTQPRVDLADRGPPRVELRF